MTRQRLVTVPTWRGGVLVMPCPPWCTSEHSGGPEHPLDFAHDGPETSLQVNTANGGARILLAGVRQTPFAMDGTHLPYATVNLDGAFHGLDPEQLRQLADGLVTHAETLRRLADQVDELRAAEPEGVS